LAECLRGQDFYAVRMAAAISLGEIGGDSARNVLVEAYRSLPNSRVRRACLWGIGKLKDDAAVELLREALTKDDSYFAAVAAARALANTGGDKAYDALVNSLGRSSWQEVIAASIFHGFAHAKEKRAVDPAIEHSKYGKPVPIRIAAIGCLAVLGKELNKDKKADRIVDHLIELTKDKNIRARVSAIRALGKVGNARALPALREAKQRECLEQLIGAALDAIKSLEE
ncbi:MAG TPA: HEAT repeat domain-containing protein, partial [Blastocatellia bacterium]|nr:HEAT repeat domain-containing protein [Blastocatellia bacterium]